MIGWKQNRAGYIKEKQMSNKYALMIGSSHAYVMGLNATLNALDYYGVKDIDVYVFSNKILKEYFNYAKEKLNYPLFFVDAEELVAPYQTEFANDGGVAWMDVMFFWGKYPLLYQIKDKYEAIGHLDGDMMVVDDISDTFKIAAETGNLLISNNNRSSLSLSQIRELCWNDNRDRLLEFCMGYPVLNYVFFFDAKKYSSLIDYVWEYRNNSIKNTKNYGLETAYFIQGIYECNLIDKVVFLPFDHWMSDDYLCKKKIPLEIDSNGKYHLIAPDGKNIQVVHGRFWNIYTTEHTIELTGKNQQECLLYNFETHTKMTDFLNYDWKVKLDDVVKLNNSYRSFLEVNRPWETILKWLKEKGLK